MIPGEAVYGVILSGPFLLPVSAGRQGNAMDTVKRDSKGFDPQVKDGETVKKGQLLMKFDLDGIKADGYDVTTTIVVTNADEFIIKTVAEGAVVPGVALLKLEAVK